MPTKMLVSINKMVRCRNMQDNCEYQPPCAPGSLSCVTSTLSALSAYTLVSWLWIWYKHSQGCTCNCKRCSLNVDIHYINHIICLVHIAVLLALYRVKAQTHACLLETSLQLWHKYLMHDVAVFPIYLLCTVLKCHNIMPSLGHSQNCLQWWITILIHGAYLFFNIMKITILTGLPHHIHTRWYKVCKEKYDLLF